ncbi:MAG: ROK family protein [Trueperaceae bacterium]|nr:ROK family protein [Trueperaceae bacterium]
MSNYSISLDIGGSHGTAALVDLEQKQIIEQSIQRQTYNHEDSAENLLAIWATIALQSLPQTPVTIRHIGLAMPAPFDYESGISLLEHKLKALFQVNVREALAKSWHGTRLESVPIYFGNDADLFALGEWWAGSAQGSKRMIGITLGTGLGAGFVEAGKVLRHDKRIPPDGEIWNLPFQDGIAEDFVSATALVKTYHVKTGKSLSGKQLAQLARQGNQEAQASFSEMGEYFAQVLEPLVYRFQPDTLVLGGNLARAFDLFGSPLERFTGLKCQISQHFEQAALFGAAALKT